MAEYLFLMTIGPVQDFIKAARRTRDLWAGSKLLSDLSRAAAKDLRDRFHATLIFPVDTTLADEHQDVANRILAYVACDNPKQLGSSIESGLRLKLKTLCITTFDNPKKIHWPDNPLQNHRGSAEAQVADLIEIYWAMQPRSTNYEKDRATLEAALAARKNTRNFVQPIWASAAPKSSIDGIRESVIDEHNYPLGVGDPERNNKIEALFKNYGAKGAERLSGVDLMKRHFRSGESLADFPSTSHFAALPLLMRNNTNHTQGLDSYIRVLENSYTKTKRPLEAMRLESRFKALNLLNGYDASILFTSRLEEDLEGDALDKARTALDIYLSQAFKMSEANPYYTLLHADGDFMGKTIDELAKAGPERHRELSQKLDAFAHKVRTLVEEQYAGALVYSGGDDVLAFLPLTTVLPCAKELATLFARLLADFSYYDEQLQRPNTPSLSAGIAICHHLEPLNDALDLARNAEKEAKKIKGKNALAITLRKRGSGNRNISGSWNELSNPHNQGFYSRLEHLIQWHREDSIPDGVAYEFHDLAMRVGHDLQLEALKHEAIRIVKRKRAQRGSLKESSKQLLALVETLPTDPAQAKHWNLAQCANELIVTRIFATALGKLIAVPAPAKGKHL